MYIGRYPLSAPGLQQTSCTSLVLLIDGSDRQTDGRTDIVPLRRRSTLEVVSDNNRYIHSGDIFVAN